MACLIPPVKNLYIFDWITDTALFSTMRNAMFVKVKRRWKFAKHMETMYSRCRFQHQQFVLLGLVVAFGVRPSHRSFVVLEFDVCKK
ncbi:Protein of unknown function [Gryllus bimaculatus]|nr:Protein of unknown function [Gryllus bimaculatus]